MVALQHRQLARHPTQAHQGLFRQHKGRIALGLLEAAIRARHIRSHRVRGVERAACGLLGLFQRAQRHPADPEPHADQQTDNGHDEGRDDGRGHTRGRRL